ncbi:MAG: PrsW family intramembrane metalloprotease [Alphaproteobacteria bacterium]|nr:PrsW family intramembrane metalloprotease [Alphaproteobacteria bacterium]
MVQIVGFALSVLVPLLALFFIHQGPHCPMPRRRWRWTGYLAGTSAFVAALVSAVAVYVISAGAVDLVDRAATTWRILPVLALIEELSRFVVLVFYSLRGPVRPGVRDGIMYGLAAGIVFALLENVMTFGGPGAGSAASGWLRIGLATPLHALLGGLMGCLLVRLRDRGAVGLAAALLVPTIVHIVYDAPVIYAVSRAGEEMSLGTAVTAISLSAAIVLGLAVLLIRLFHRAAPAAPAARS